MRVDKNQPTTQELLGFEFYDRGHRNRNSFIKSPGGMPLRLELAARMMQGWVSNSSPIDEDEFQTPKDVAELSFQLADALIEEHNRTCEEKP
jgi:hypothetical protein